MTVRTTALTQQSVRGGVRNAGKRRRNEGRIVANDMVVVPVGTVMMREIHRVRKVVDTVSAKRKGSDGRRIAVVDDGNEMLRREENVQKVHPRLNRGNRSSYSICWLFEGEQRHQYLIVSEIVRQSPVHMLLIKL